MLTALVFLAVAHAAGEDCDKKATGPTTLKLLWNQYASEWGMYTVEGCNDADGNSIIGPKLHLSAGVEYTWDQSDISNWYHPVGFSYVAGGAHTVCKDDAGAEGECPELGDEAGDGSTSTIYYHVNGAKVTDDESTFGLDAYEPLFFKPQDWWSEQPTFKVTLTIPTDAKYTRIYYFCHIHSGMSAEIEIDGASGGNVLNPAVLGSETEESALAIFTDIVSKEQGEISEFDKMCGFHASSQYSEHSDCENAHFLCGAAATDDFSKCLAAIDCQMHYEMAVGVPAGASKFATFARQMIPHHQNAVAMAKALELHMKASDFGAPNDEDIGMDWAKGLVRNIINVQNKQIQEMQAWLDAAANKDLVGEHSYCYETDPISMVPSGDGPAESVATGAGRLLFSLLPFE